MINETEKGKNITRKTLAEVNNPGVLNANITRLTKQLSNCTTERQWIPQQIEDATNEISRKQLQVKLKRLDEKIERKISLIEIAYKRLNQLLDAELGEQSKTEKEPNNKEIDNNERDVNEDSEGESS